jgi:cytochrome c oxidase subunit 2
LKLAAAAADPVDREASLSVLSGIQSAFNPQSPDAAAIAGLTWVLVFGAAALLVLVVALTLVAIRRRPPWLACERAVVVGGILLPAVAVFALLLHSLGIASARDTGPADVRIEVIGHQWWWRIRYLNVDGSVDFETANEIRLPERGRAEIALRSEDVLHSFWVPALAGKLDLVPGRTNRMRLAATNAGVYRGQCAEYCGGPHAQMALYVVVEPRERFDQWRDRQRAPATAIDDRFVEHCAVCHTVRGTPAAGTRGPDLTHVGSRHSIGAGILRNDVDTLREWIAGSQHIKPGNLMPSFSSLQGAELAQVAAYVSSLQ